MARRRRGDRVDLFTTGGAEFDAPNGTLPRSSYRDSEQGLLYKPAGAAVDRSGWLHSFTPYLSFEPSPAKHRAKRDFVARYPRWQYVLNRAPSRVKFCLERGQRREVLFALKKAGFRGSAPKRRYRRTANSNYGC